MLMTRILASAIGIFVASVVVIFLGKMFTAGRHATGLGHMKVHDGPMFCAIGLLYLIAGICMIVLVPTK